MRISTYSGRQVDLLNLQPADVDIEDIAHALSQLCRYNGQCRRFYSVAEHSVAVAAYCPPRLRLYGLLHDAAEAYCGDIARPIKEEFPQIARWEAEVQHRIQSSLGLGWYNAAADESLPPPVRIADDRMLATEAPKLGVKLDREFEPYHGHQLACYDPLTAKQRFLEAWQLLTRDFRTEAQRERAWLLELCGQTGQLLEASGPADGTMTTRTDATGQGAPATEPGGST